MEQATEDAHRADNPNTVDADGADETQTADKPQGTQTS